MTSEQVKAYMQQRDLQARQERLEEIKRLHLLIPLPFIEETDRIAKGLENPNHAEGIRLRINNLPPYAA